MHQLMRPSLSWTTSLDNLQVMSTWMPAEKAISEMIATHAANPIEGAKRKIEHIYKGEIDSDIAKDMLACNKDGMMFSDTQEVLFYIARTQQHNSRPPGSKNYNSRRPSDMIIHSRVHTTQNPCCPPTTTYSINQRLWFFSTTPQMFSHRKHKLDPTRRRPQPH